MAEKMKAAVITGVKKIEVIDVPMPNQLDCVPGNNVSIPAKLKLITLF
jgi:hypothetical protein